jgi:hypothetical protein
MYFVKEGLQPQKIYDLPRYRVVDVCLTVLQTSFSVPYALLVHSPKSPTSLGFIAHLRLIFTAV